MIVLLVFKRSNAEESQHMYSQRSKVQRRMASLFRGLVEFDGSFGCKFSNIHDCDRYYNEAVDRSVGLEARGAIFSTICVDDEIAKIVYTNARHVEEAMTTRGYVAVKFASVNNVNVEQGAVFIVERLDVGAKRRLRIEPMRQT